MNAAGPTEHGDLDAMAPAPGRRHMPLPAGLTGVRVALVHDWLTGMRGGERVPIAKFSEGKGTLPGPHQVWRFRGEQGGFEDVIGLVDEDPRTLAEGPIEALLVPAMKGGKRTEAAEWRVRQVLSERVR